MMYINKLEIIKTINSKRNAIHEEIKNLEYCIVTLLDEDNSLLTRGINYIGSSEYGDCVDLNKVFTVDKLKHLTINSIDIWLRASLAILEGPRGFKTTIFL